MSRSAAIIDPRESAGRGMGTCAVRWVISPDALRMYAPAMLNGHAARVSAAELVIEIGEIDGRIRATLRLRYGSEQPAIHELPLPCETARTTRSEDGRMLHTEAPGVISLTVLADGSRRALLYSHTPLLAAIGLPGGVYDVPELI